MTNQPQGNASTPRPTVDGETIWQRMNPNEGQENNPGLPAGCNPPAKYTVAAGDTPATIAQKVYGDSTQWQRIFDANQAVLGNDPTQVPVGTPLVIPSAPQEAPSQNPPSWSNPTFRHW